ncbi:DUF3857 domain-containing protein [Polaribacter aestuariivivens]|uniref:DUF3857 domain-containing protein n=1 Tax=Polaribacter aestuariivivens TaxID=2304626 RepID=A0A5S3NFP8_9FLAO|nr:DUF3857 domain-containing protein [Polaribacter aestuariivivens]TMM32386.1 DUF3857 domain-containing protein [Polaribacter aestuariivivens]
MKKIIFTLFLMNQIVILAQDYKFGKVSKEELTENFYPLDSTADAAYLYKSRRTYFDFSVSSGNFQLVTDFHERIKIYTKEGFDFATKSVVYYNPDSGESETVSSIKGYTFYLENGKVKKEKLSSKSIFKDKLSKFNSVKKITMPNIKEGVVIELRYKVISPYATSIDDLELQFGIPVKKLHSQVEIPEYYVFNKKSIGYHHIKMETDSKSGRIGNTGYRINVYEFNDTNIPALKDNEPYISSVKNYRGGMSFELTQTNLLSIGGGIESFSNTWENVSKKIYKRSSFGGELSKSSYYKDDLETILATAKTDSDKVISIFKFVKNQIKWNGYYGIYSDNGVRKAYKERVGNVADINLMLTAMLRSANLNADPVLVSTRTNGVPFFPTIDGFNYVISLVEFSAGGFMLLDATEPFSSPNILPRRTLNWNGRRISKNGNSSWIRLTSSTTAAQENNIMINISDDLKVKGLLRTKFFNLDALTYRRNHNHLNEEDIITNLEEKSNIEIEDFKLVNKKAVEKPVIRNVKFSSEDLIESINGKLYIEPLLFLSQHKNPFKLEERKFPVDFTSPWSIKNVVSIKLPKGYKAENLPESLAIGLPENLGVFKFQVTEAAGKINTICVLQFNSAIVAPQHYSALKDFYGKLVKKESEKIVLVKI